MDTIAYVKEKPIPQNSRLLGQEMKARSVNIKSKFFYFIHFLGDKTLDFIQDGNHEPECSTRLSKMDQLQWNHCAFVSIFSAVFFVVWDSRRL